MCLYISLGLLVWDRRTRADLSWVTCSYMQLQAWPITRVILYTCMNGHPYRNQEYRWTKRRYWQQRPARSSSRSWGKEGHPAPGISPQMPLQLTQCRSVWRILKQSMLMRKHDFDQDWCYLELEDFVSKETIQWLCCRFCFLNRTVQIIGALKHACINVHCQWTYRLQG